eukprot:Platyproteum_vivax@DN2895_c0_g1_i2.p1
MYIDIDMYRYRYRYRYVYICLSNCWMQKSEVDKILNKFWGESEMSELLKTRRPETNSSESQSNAKAKEKVNEKAYKQAHALMGNTLFTVKKPEGLAIDVFDEAIYLLNRLLMPADVDFKFGRNPDHTEGRRMVLEKEGSANMTPVSLAKDVYRALLMVKFQQKHTEGEKEKLQLVRRSSQFVGWMRMEGTPVAVQLIVVGKAEKLDDYVTDYENQHAFRVELFDERIAQILPQHHVLSPLPLEISFMPGILEYENFRELTNPGSPAPIETD